MVGSRGVVSALLGQIRCQQAWLKARSRGITNSKVMLTSMRGIDLQGRCQSLSQAKEPFSLSRLIRREKEYHFLNPVTVNCTSNEDIALQYTNFLKDGFNVVNRPKKPTPCRWRITMSCAVRQRHRNVSSVMTSTSVPGCR